MSYSIVASEEGRGSQDDAQDIKEHKTIIKMTAANQQPVVPLLPRIASALFYGIASLMITVVNKTVLTSYGFPSFQVLGIGQMLATIIALFLAKKLNYVEFPSFDTTIISKIFPLPLIYIGNMVFGLGGTKQLSLPMFTALRRFSILMTMAAEYYILGVSAKVHKTLNNR